MEGTPKLALGFCKRGMIGVLLMAFALLVPVAAANSGDSPPPPPPTVTSPSADSRLPNPKKVTVRGTAPAFTKVSVKVGVTRVRNGKLVEERSVGPRGMKVSNGQWEVDMDLPDMQRGWDDVRYKITATLYWDKRPEQHLVSDKPSEATIVWVYPQAQPEPLPVAPARPEILTPSSSSLLQREPNFSITGTGTPGNQIHVSTRLHFAMENRPTYEFSPYGQSDKVTVDKSGKWGTVLGYGGFTEPGYVNARVRITVTESHRENHSLVSPEVVREVPVEVPPKGPSAPPTRAEIISNAVKLPDHVIASSKRMDAMSAAERASLLKRPSPMVTSPDAHSAVSGSVEPKGTAAPGSNLQINVKRVASAPGRVRGKSRPSMASQDLGTFTTTANASGDWSVSPVTLPTLKSDAMDVTVVVSVVEINADGSSGTAHTVTLKQVN